MSFSDEPKAGHENVDLMPLFKYAFNVFCLENELEGPAKEKADLREFMGWFNDWMKYANLSELEHETGLSVDALAHLQENSDSPAYLAPLSNYWHLIVLEGRGMPKHAVGGFQMVIMVRYRDGRVLPMTAYMPEELSDPLNDASLATAIAQQLQAVIGTIHNVGIDGMYQQSIDRDDPTIPPQLTSQLPGDPMFPSDVAAKIVETRKLSGIVSKVPPQEEDLVAEPKPPAQVSRPDPVKIAGGFARGNQV